MIWGSTKKVVTHIESARVTCLRRLLLPTATLLLHLVTAFVQSSSLLNPRNILLLANWTFFSLDLSAPSFGQTNSAILQDLDASIAPINVMHVRMIGCLRAQATSCSGNASVKEPAVANAPTQELDIM